VWQSYDKCAAPPLPGSEVDIPSMHIKDFSDNTQAYTGAFLFCGKKRYKYL
jgi:hypothetical protein